jgi:SAM-dependent methyltransferase
MAEQATIFSAGEGDAWFDRNRPGQAAYDLAGDPLHAFLRTAAIAPRSILDLGCSAGVRLSAWCQHHAASGVGIDPAAAAIADAQARDPQRSWLVGTLDSHPPLNRTFDLVIVSFVLHWVDRRLLLASLAGIDRAVAEGGHVLIADFATDHPVRREYHHLAGQGIYTYKNDYPAMLLATGLYRPVLRQSLAYPSYAPVTAGDRDRVQCALLERISAAAIPCA